MIIVYRGLYWGPPILGNYHIDIIVNIVIRCMQGFVFDGMFLRCGRVKTVAGASFCN